MLRSKAPTIPVVNLCADVPRQNPRAAAYLLAALRQSLPQPAVWLCVIDPGVGTGRDRPVMMSLDDCWFVGPDNGLFDVVGRRARRCACYDITWQPGYLSRSFHGRDLYAPVAAALAAGHRLPGELRDWQPRHHRRPDLNEIIYMDAFGNAITGMRATSLNAESRLVINGEILCYASTFGDVPEGTAFWYENSNGLVEVAVNRGNAIERLNWKWGLL
ncbi:MAG: SAM-dependent chlorinase/fluorinase [Gammaproteobacteria bacterium]|nr:SAM-dependent chlorinase/fluorinase [Gammaproteobacteria bacterium]